MFLWCYTRQITIYNTNVFVIHTQMDRFTALAVYISHLAYYTRNSGRETEMGNGKRGALSKSSKFNSS